jgi:hypothetical protein
MAANCLDCWCAATAHLERMLLFVLTLSGFGKIVGA